MAGGTPGYARYHRSSCPCFLTEITNETATGPDLSHVATRAAIDLITLGEIANLPSIETEQTIQEPIPDISPAPIPETLRFVHFLSPPKCRYYWRLLLPALRLVFIEHGVAY